MKLLRVAFFVLLAALLPARGAMSATMQCPAPASMPVSAAAAVSTSHHGGHHDHAAMEAAAAVADDGCDLCAAFCSLTTLPSAVAVVAAAPAPGAARFPDRAAPVPNFLPDGRERPPRST